MLTKYISIVLGVLTLFISTAAQRVPEEQALDDGRQWIGSVTLPKRRAPPLLRAAVANARNQTVLSEALLLNILRSQPGSDSARWAHELLSRIYFRTGQYRRLVTNLDQWAAEFPADPHLLSEKADAEQFRGLPDQINRQLRASRLRHGPGNDFSAHVLINGRPTTYLLDTGAWVSVMTEAEAKRLGMSIREGPGMLNEPSGKGITVRTAVAHKLVIGSFVFENVSFAILPDVEPWRSMPVGRRGIIGIPVLLQLGCLRWTRGGAWEFGCRSRLRTSDTANLVFYKNKLLLASTVEDRRVFLPLDTGAGTTDLNLNFAREFAAQIQQHGTKTTTPVTGAGGTTVIDSVTLPQVDFLIGNKSATLRSAQVTMQENPALGGGCCVGNIGLDLLLQTGAITIDFSRMTLRLR